jgi:hypothetical protein
VPVRVIEDDQEMAEAIATGLRRVRMAGSADGSLAWLDRDVRFLAPLRRAPGGIPRPTPWSSRSRALPPRAQSSHDPPAGRCGLRKPAPGAAAHTAHHGA